MKHISKFKRFKDWKDKISEIEYRKIMGLDFIFVTPKERKLLTLSALTERDKKYWDKLSSKQLGKVLLDKEREIAYNKNIINLVNNGG